MTDRNQRHLAPHDVGQQRSQAPAHLRYVAANHGAHLILRHCLLACALIVGQGALQAAPAPLAEVRQESGDLHAARPVGRIDVAKLPEHGDTQALGGRVELSAPVSPEAQPVAEQQAQAERDEANRYGIALWAIHVVIFLFGVAIGLTGVIGRGPVIVWGWPPLAKGRPWRDA